jgi:CRISPR-associated endonuclease Csn1
MKILGLDVGINSIGFALVELDLDQPENNGIVTKADRPCVGAHLFDRAEQPKTGASLALPRRMARSQRRLIRRRADRKKRLRDLFAETGLPIGFTQSSEGFDKTPWELRADGLERRLTPEEFARVLYHLAKRRGFQSTRKDQGDKNNDESKKMLGEAAKLRKEMKDRDYQTVGAYLANHPDKKQRNGGEGDYSKTVLREWVKEETHRLFEKQRGFGNAWATPDFEGRFSEIAFYQRPLRSCEHLVGWCSLEPEEKRAPKHSRSAELFVLWQKINHLRLENEKSDNTLALTPEQRSALFEKCHEIQKVDYGHIRKIIGDFVAFNGELLPYRFKGLIYSATAGGKGKRKKGGKGGAPEAGLFETEAPSDEVVRTETEKNKPFIELKGFHAMKTAFGIDKQNLREKLASIDTQQWDRIARLLTYEENEQALRKELMADTPILTEEQVESLLQIHTFKGAVSLSVKAITKLLPHLERGETYDRACELGGYPFSAREPGRRKRLPKFEKTRNPVVDRALAQCRKVINAVIHRYGRPDAIHIELARDVGKTFEQRREIELRMEKNREQNEQVRRDAEQLGVDPLKYRLWKEQGGFCMYSGKHIDPDRLRDPLATQIDHILPFSRTFDDSRNNLTLCLWDENQNKRNDIPSKYFQRCKSDEEWARLEAQVASLPWQKRRRFLLKDLSAETENAWKERHLNDTRWIARTLKNHIEKHLDFSGAEGDRKRRVIVLSGGITATLRRLWGLSKDREENTRHHAQDALVIACASQSMVQRVTEYNKYEGRHKNQEVAKPWPTFRDDVIRAVNGTDGVGGIFVSRLPNRKMSGELHAATLWSRRPEHLPTDGGALVQRIPLSRLTPALLENLVDKERNIRLYHVLKERLDRHGGDPKKAFQLTIHMPARGGRSGPQIRSVRVRLGARSGLEIRRGKPGDPTVRKGVASNGDMLRVDVFEKKGKFYLCPVYTWHAYHETLPDRLIKQGVPEEEWPIIDDTYQFKFSLYKNDLVKVRKSKSDKDEFFYYVKTDRSNASIDFLSHDAVSSKQAQGLGVQRLSLFEKYVVNYFGEVFPVRKEIRRGLANPSRRKSRFAQPQPATTGVPPDEPGGFR